MMSRVKKSQMYLDQIPKLEKDYANVIASSFRTLEVISKFWFDPFMFSFKKIYQYVFKAL